MSNAELIAGSPGLVASPLPAPSYSVSLSASPEAFKTLHLPDQAVTFGHDEKRCDLHVRPGADEAPLLPIAGVIWRHGDQLWLRNLSTSHELSLVGPADEGPRRVRRGSTIQLPHAGFRILGPGGCDLTVTRD